MPDANPQRRQRQSALAKRRSLTDTERSRHSASITRHFLASRWFASATRIGVYLPADDEVDTRAIIDTCWRANREIYVPVVGPRSTMKFRRMRADTMLKPNQFGLLEPHDGNEVRPQRLDVVITPVVAFDSHGHRIGMGGGFFDRTFAYLKHRRHFRRPQLIGLAFDCQRVHTIVANRWDISLSALVTESGVSAFRPAIAEV